MGDFQVNDLGVPNGTNASEYEKDELDALATLVDTGTSDAIYSGWETIRGDGFDPSALSPELSTDVYGLDDMRGPEDTLSGQKSGRGVMPLVFVLVLALAGLGGYMAWRRMSSEPAEREPAVVATIEPTPVAEAQEAEPVAPVLGLADIEGIVSGGLTFEGESVTVDLSRIIVDERDGRVLVTHQLQPEDVPNPERLTRMAGIRAHALAQQLKDKQVGLTSDAQGSAFQDVTWVVRNADGEAFIAVREIGGDLRTSVGTYGILDGSDGYALSRELLDALGSDSGLSEQAGTTPTDLEGNPIVVTAKLAKEQESPQSTQSTTTRRQTYHDDDDEDEGGQTTYNPNPSHSGQTSDPAGDTSNNNAPSDNAGNNTGDTAGDNTGGEAGGNTGGDTGGDAGSDTGNTTGGGDTEGNAGGNAGDAGGSD